MHVRSIALIGVTILLAFLTVFFSGKEDTRKIATKIQENFITLIEDQRIDLLNFEQSHQLIRTLLD